MHQHVAGLEQANATSTWLFPPLRAHPTVPSGTHSTSKFVQGTGQACGGMPHRGTEARALYSGPWTPAGADPSADPSRPESAPMNKPFRVLVLVVLAALATALVVAGCESEDSGDKTQTRAFTLQFAAVDGDVVVGCGDEMTGFGLDGLTTVSIADLRFFVSNLRFYNSRGELVVANLTTNDFEYVDPDGDGQVALVDLTSTALGACSGAGISAPEGTARTNSMIMGTVDIDQITGVAFDIGMPQPVMKKTLASHQGKDPT